MQQASWYGRGAWSGVYIEWRSQLQSVHAVGVTRWQAPILSHCSSRPSLGGAWLRFPVSVPASAVCRPAGILELGVQVAVFSLPAGRLMLFVFFCVWSFCFSLHLSSCTRFRTTAC